jgi:hypothetical protein
MKKIRRENLGAKLHGGKNKINQRRKRSSQVTSPDTYPPHHMTLLSGEFFLSISQTERKHIKQIIL